MTDMDKEFLTITSLEETVGRDSLLTLLKMHRINVNDTIAQLCLMQDSIDYAEIHMIAHRLRGACGSLGFTRLSELFRHMDQSTKEPDDKTTHELIAQIVEENNLLKVAVHARYPEINI